MNSRLLVVDRIEGGIAVLVGDDERSLDVDLRQLPKGIREGNVIRVQVAEDERLVWSSAVVDEEAEAERLRQAESVLRELRARDPGGDVDL